MSIVMMIVGWITTIGMIAFCALHQSSQLPTIPKDLAASLETAPSSHSFWSTERRKYVIGGE